jgi:hydroxyethylthiazole kinase-like uncharacterized protein yjeF
MQTVTKVILKKVYRKKSEWLHKGDYGRLLVVCGSYRMTGSPVIVGLAALRTGVDVVCFAGPERAMYVAAAAFPTFITQPLKGNFLNKQHADEVIGFADEMRISGLAIGPGLWRLPETREAVVKIIERLEVPMVIDADAIRAMNVATDVLRKKTAVLTPHADELFELSGRKVSTQLDDRIKTVKEVAKQLNTTIVLKGHVDVISDGGKILLNRTGNVHMTKGGFGDSLTGICAAFMARRKNRVDPLTAAAAAAYINGRAGDLAVKKFKEGVLP